MNKIFWVALNLWNTYLKYSHNQRPNIRGTSGSDDLIAFLRAGNPCSKYFRGHPADRACDSLCGESASITDTSEAKIGKKWAPIIINKNIRLETLFNKVQ